MKFVFRPNPMPVALFDLILGKCNYDSWYLHFFYDLLCLERSESLCFCEGVGLLAFRIVEGMVYVFV